MEYRTFWLGGKSPDANYTVYNGNIRDTIRFSSEFHGQFNQVFCIDEPISSFRNWPFILDELLRLASEECVFTMVFGMGENYFSVANFYKQIFNKFNGNCKLDSIEKINECGGFKVAFSVTQRKIDLKRDWTFGVIWDGKNKEYLTEFIDSILAQKIDDERIEIIVCGPRIETYPNVKFVEADPQAELQGNISRKKNLIVQNAKYENICIVHNRYKLEDDFVSSFRLFGYDFELCIVPQVLVNTLQRVPDWVSQASDNALTRNYWLSYGEYSPFQYSPGGMTIGKRQVLLEVPWNDLATWNMAEDVELSQRLRDRGFLYKLNNKTTVKVLSLRKEIINDFNASDLRNYYCNIDQFGESRGNKSLKVSVVIRMFIITYLRQVKNFISNLLRR